MPSLRSPLIAALIIIATAAACFGAGCGSGSQSAGERTRIGTIQIVEHRALDQAREGFVQGLADAGFGPDKVEYDVQNAQGDMSTAQTIAQKFVDDRVDLILAIATPTSQAAAQATADIPILITAVTDPVAAGLVESLESPGTNVTGTTDMTPVAEQLELLTQLCPDARRIGVLYNAGEVNSVVQVGLAQAAAVDLGLEIVEGTVANVGEVRAATESLVGRVDAIYIPTDNTVVSGAEAALAVADQHSLPVISGESSVVEAGGLATCGIDYYELGVQTGKMAAEVLKGKDPATMPIGAQEETTLVINQASAERLGLDIDAGILEQAELIEK